MKAKRRQVPKTRVRKPCKVCKPVVLKRYQGKEIQATIQAPTLRTLNAMISGMKAYARRESLGAVKVLSRGRDIDGGYKAVVSAHNFNPFKWVASKWRGRGGGWESRMAKATIREQHRLRQSKLKEAKLLRKEELLLAKERKILAKARVEEAEARRQAAITARKHTRYARPSRTVRLLRGI